MRSGRSACDGVPLPGCAERPGADVPRDGAAVGRRSRPGISRMPGEAALFDNYACGSAPASMSR